MRTNLKNEAGGGGKLSLTRLKLTLVALAGLFASCVTEGPDVSPKVSPEAEAIDQFTIPVEKALDEMYDLMDVLYGAGTRAASREIATVETLKGSSIAGNLTRSSGGTLPENLLYVVNFTNNGGFAVLGADQTMDPVYCVTESGSFDMGTMQGFLSGMQGPSVSGPATLDPFQPFDPDGPGMEIALPEWYMAYYMYLVLGYDDDTLDVTGIPINTGNGVPEYPKISSSAGPWEDDVTEIIGPMLTTRWNQGNPYNMHCPQDGEEYSDAGCVAIALAQIIAYNEKPAPSAFGSNVTMSWDEIKAPNYNDRDIYGWYNSDPPLPGTEGYEPAHQLGMIIRKIGNKVDMNYSANGSGGSEKDAKKYLEDLGYDSVDLSNEYDYGDIEYMLYGDRPAYISAFRRDAKNKGHAWVIDGLAKQYRTITTTVVDLVPTGSGGFRQQTTVHTSKVSRVLMHCNFGWGGTSDGYYLSNVFDAKTGPVVDDDDDPGTSGGLYNIDHSMILYKK